MSSLASRNEMVDRQIAARGVRDQRVLDAMRQVPREKFVAEHLRDFAYEDNPLPIDSGQTISQPYVVACMIEALELTGEERVLEIGTGSGYAAAILGEVASEVFTVERIGSLASQAREILRELDYDNVHVLHGDGTRGWPEQAPFDAIVVAAGGPRVPESLKTQLKISGRMVIPVGSTPHSQQLMRITRESVTAWNTEIIAGVRFVPLIGREGWAGRQDPG